jgi:hypothetical protein
MPSLTVRIRLKGLVKYLLENWGAPFILTFMFLLVAAAAYLALGLETVANDLAVYAYYFLVSGVFLQLACYLKYGRKSGKSDD